MKKVLSVAVVVFALISPRLWAGETNITGFASTSFESEYLGLIGLEFSRSPVNINIVQGNYKGFHLGAFNCNGLTGHRYGTHFCDEWDVFGGWGHLFTNSFLPTPVRLDVSASYFALAQLDRMKDDIWVADQEVSFPKLPLLEKIHASPFIHSRYFESVGEGHKSGWFVFFGIREVIQFGHGAAGRPYSLNLSASGAYACGALHDFNGLVYGRGTMAFNIPLSESLTLIPNVLYQVAAPGQRSNPNGFTDGNKFVYGLSLLWTF